LTTTATSVAVRVRAHAKINLDLRVLGIRSDGFHELSTVYQSLALYDTLTFKVRRGPFKLECNASGVSRDRSNLIWQAAERLWQMLGKAGRLRDVTVHLDKRVPVEAGLGGGSADAAATLRALARLWRARVRTAELVSVAVGLGADVPFFLHGGTALGLGRGDKITRLPDMLHHSVVLMVPGFGVSSRDAYGWYEADKTAPTKVTPAFESPWSPQEARIRNDLEYAVTRQRPELGEMKAALERVGACAAAMSGSGSTVYGLFKHRDEARIAAGRLERGSWRIVLTELLDRRTYSSRARPYGAKL
jgi:4-diphosphocytidyl-2-C-methyl-D-erythritol kinase